MFVSFNFLLNKLSLYYYYYYRLGTKYDGRLCFRRCVSVQLSKWGYPIQLTGRGVPHPRSRWGVPHPADWGYPTPGQDGGYPIQLTGGTPSQVQGVPHLADGGVPPSRPGIGYHPSPPRHETKQHSEHLLCGGRYASCVQAGRLSCYIKFY